MYARSDVSVRFGFSPYLLENRFSYAFVKFNFLFPLHTLVHSHIFNTYPKSEHAFYSIHLHQYSTIKKFTLTSLAPFFALDSLVLGGLASKNIFCHVLSLQCIDL